MSLSAMFTQARRAAFAALALAAAPAALTTSAEARDYEIVITISQLTALDAADVWLAGPDDFYARVTIDGEVFSTRIKRQQNVAQPNWKITKVVSNRKVDVRLEIYDKDIGKPDDKIDINRITPNATLTSSSIPAAAASKASPIRSAAATKSAARAMKTRRPRSSSTSTQSATDDGRQRRARGRAAVGRTPARDCHMLRCVRRMVN